MQTVYIDTLLCINLFIDYILLYTVKRLLHLNAKTLRLLLAALTGAVITLGVFFPFYNTVFSVIYKTASAVLIVFTAFGKCRLKLFIIRVLSYAGVSIAFSGIIALIWLCFKPDGVVIYNGAVYLDISPILLIVCTLIAFISLSIYERLKAKTSHSTAVHTVTVMSEKSVYSFKSMVDTGCNLKEPFSGLPVIIAEKELMNPEDIPKENLRVVPYKTLSGEGMLYAFRPKNVHIDGKELKSGCFIAISEGKLNNEVKSLMGSEITEGI